MGGIIKPSKQLDCKRSQGAEKMGGSGGEHVSCLWLKKPELSKYLGSVGPCLSLFERSQIYGSKGTARPAVPWGRDFLEEFTHVTEKTPWWSF